MAAGNRSGSGGLLCLRRAPVNSPGDGIAWVPVAPLRLRLLPASGLTFRRVAGPLPVSCSQTPAGTTGGRSCMVSSGPLAS